MSNDAPLMSLADAGFGISGAVRAASGTMITMTITTRMRGGAG